jgi:hypothetical protein
MRLKVKIETPAVTERVECGIGDRDGDSVAARSPVGLTCLGS